MFAAKKILVPVDFTDTSRKAISAALQLAANAHGEVWLLTVDHKMDHDLAEDIKQHTEVPLIEERIQLGESMLMDAVKQECEQGRELGLELGEVPVHARVTGGNPLSVSLQMIDELQIDAVVTGTHGRVGVKQRVMRSISERLAARAPCSVFVVKPKGFPYLRD